MPRSKPCIVMQFFIEPSCASVRSFKVLFGRLRAGVRFAQRKRSSTHAQTDVWIQQTGGVCPARRNENHIRHRPNGHKSWLRRHLPHLSSVF